MEKQNQNVQEAWDDVKKAFAKLGEPSGQLLQLFKPLFGLILKILGFLLILLIVIFLMSKSGIIFLYAIVAVSITIGIIRAIK